MNIQYFKSHLVFHTASKR